MKTVEVLMADRRNGTGAGRFMRSVALIMAMAMVMSSLLFYFEEDLNYAAKGLAAPALKKLVYSQTKAGKYQAKLTWKAKKGAYYQVLRKTSKNGRYSIIARLKASSATGSYTDKKIGKNKTFTYSVRRVTMKGGKVSQTGKYDSAGLTTLKIPSLSVDFTNLNAVLSWKKVSGATRYHIYRRVGKSTKFYDIKNVASSSSSYTDWWYWATHGLKSKAYSTTLAGIITRRLRGVFLDMSNNPVSYKVQAYSAKTVNFVKKESYGLVLKDGEFRLETPTITDLTNRGLLTWGHVANAEGYRLYKSPDGKNWTKITDVKSTGSDYIPAERAKLDQIFQEYQIPDYDPSAYYTVRAYASKNGSRLYSKYDKAFTAKNRKYSEKVLFVGDSIGYGSPYYENERKDFAYANRIRELTGISFFNPSIPGSTYHFGAKDSAESEEESDTSTSKLITGIVQMVVKGEDTDKRINVDAGPNKTVLTDYDVVVLAGGTNDYLHYDASVGSAAKLIGSREKDWEKITDKTANLTFTNNKGTAYEKKYTESYDYNIKTFDGAYNQIMKWIEAASVYRVQHGLKPIQVVSMSMFYSDRAKAPYKNKTDRNTTKNSLGLTLKDYQAELDALNSAWSGSAALSVYRYDTQNRGLLGKKTCPYMTADNIHLTKYTYAQYGNDLSSFMMQYFLGKEKDADAESAEFLALAAKHGLLSEKLAYLEEKAAEDAAGEGMVLQGESAYAVLGLYSGENADESEELSPAVEEMKAYIRLLYDRGLLDQMLSECSEEDRERYVRFIEFYDLLNENAEGEADENQEQEAFDDEDEYEADENEVQEQEVFDEDGAEETEDASDVSDTEDVNDTGDAADQGDAEAGADADVPESGDDLSGPEE